MEDKITPRFSSAAYPGWPLAPTGAIRANREEDPGSRQSPDQTVSRNKAV